jgi:RES domain-containing protein
MPVLSWSEADVPGLLIEPWPQDDFRARALLESEVLSREFGDAVLLNRAMPAVLVPSAIIPQEFNLLINPDCEGFNRIQWSPPQPFRIDPRLLDAGLR